MFDGPRCYSMHGQLRGHHWNAFIKSLWDDQWWCKWYGNPKTWSLDPLKTLKYPHFIPGRISIMISHNYVIRHHCDDFQEWLKRIRARLFVWISTFIMNFYNCPDKRGQHFWKHTLITKARFQYTEVIVRKFSWAIHGFRTKFMSNPNCNFTLSKYGLEIEDWRKNMEDGQKF